MENNLKMVKKELISEIRKRTEDRIIEVSNAKLLEKLINNAETTTEALAIAELGTTYKRTGFHFDKRLEKIGEDIKYLKKNESLSFENGGLHHKLIIGDNYDALLNLLITHKGKIDVIYIDPPYGKDSMGAFADTNYNNAITRDNLLSMLYPRLQLAKLLLTDDGVIFCSIDDRNQAYVKGLMDEVFGEQNFIQCYTWECNFKPDNSSPLKRPNAEYILCYAHDLSALDGFHKYPSKTSGMASLTKDTEKIKEIIFPENTVKTTLPNGHYNAGKYYDDGWELLNDIDVYEGGIVSCVRLKGKSYWSTDDKIKTEIDNKTEIWIKSKKFIPYYRKSKSSKVVPTTILPREYISDYGNSKLELKNILSANVFDNPKPTSLIKFLENLIDNPNATVLDFFAGSGTTGQAVLELNKEDGGNRTFILCTNNEKEDGYIATNVTSKRLKRVMTGSCYDGNSDFAWIKKNDPLGDSLDVYDIASVHNAEQEEGKSPFDVIDETCYGLQKFESLENKITWICTNFENTQKYLEVPKDVTGSN